MAAGALLRGQLGRALAELQRAAHAYSLLDMPLYEASMRFHTGVLRGGDTGRQLVELATEQGRALGLAQPDGWFHAPPGLFSRRPSLNGPRSATPAAQAGQAGADSHWRNMWFGGAAMACGAAGSPIALAGAAVP